MLFTPDFTICFSVSLRYSRTACCLRILLLRSSKMPLAIYAFLINTGECSPIGLAIFFFWLIEKLRGESWTGVGLRSCLLPNCLVNCSTFCAGSSSFFLLLFRKLWSIPFFEDPPTDLGTLTFSTSWLVALWLEFRVLRLRLRCLFWTDS